MPKISATTFYFITYIYILTISIHLYSLYIWKNLLFSIVSLFASIFYIASVSYF